MDKIVLYPMTRELCHQYYRKFENDPAIFTDMSLFGKYQYNRDKVDKYFDSQRKENRVVFIIVREDTPIGEIKLKDVDSVKRECSLGIHMLNDSVKGKGYGTYAERLALQHALDVLGMRAVNADTVKKNKRSQHVLEKVGFCYVGEDDIFKYYRYERGNSILQKKNKDFKRVDFI